MSASRTLLRKTLADISRRQKPENKRVKPGTDYRRHVATGLRKGETFHVTKGRIYRRPE